MKAKKWAEGAGFAQHPSGSRLAPQTSTIKTQKTKRKRREENGKCWEAAICPLLEGWRAREPGLQPELASAVLLGPLWPRRAALPPWAFFPSPYLRMHTVSWKVSVWTEFGRALS